MSNDAQDWWDNAVERNRAALLRIVAVLFVYAGLDEGGADVVPRRVWRMVLRLLRPAESAVRRLIVVAARDIEVAPPIRRAEKAPTAIEQLQAAGFLVFRDGVDLGLARAPRSEAPVPQTSESRTPAFPLADPPRRFDARSWNGGRPFPQDGFELADADEPVAAARLCRRLKSLKNALDDLPRQAVRLARRNARAQLASTSMQGAKIIRRGHPPGHRRKPVHRVDDILGECHGLAMSLQRQHPDTS